MLADEILASYTTDADRWAAAEAVALTLYLTVDRDAVLAAFADGSALAHNGAVLAASPVEPGVYATADHTYRIF